MYVPIVENAKGYNILPKKFITLDLFLNKIIKNEIGAIKIQINS